MNRYGEQLDSSTIRFERIIAAPIERVWAFLVEPEKRQQWFCAGDFDLRPGGRAQFQFDHSRFTDDSPPKRFAEFSGPVDMEGTIVEVDPPNRLVFDWPDPDGKTSRVHIELEPAGDKVKLTLIHSGLSSGDGMIQTASGWHGHLDILDAVLTLSAAPGFWTAFEMLLREYAERLGNRSAK